MDFGSSIGDPSASLFPGKGSGPGFSLSGPPSDCQGPGVGHEGPADDGKRNEMEMNVVFESRRPNGRGSGGGLARDRAGIWVGGFFFVSFSVPFSCLFFVRFLKGLGVVFWRSYGPFGSYFGVIWKSF